MVGITPKSRAANETSPPAATSVVAAGEAGVKGSSRPQRAERDSALAPVGAYPEPRVGVVLAAIILPDGNEALIRTISTGDADLLHEMFLRLSPETIYRRFHSPYPSVPKRMLAYLTEADQRNGESLVAMAGKDIVGHVMYVPTDGGGEAEVAVVVEDAWQRKGIGSLLLRKLAVEARRRGVEVFTAEVLAENHPMLALVRATFAEAEYEVRSGLYRVRVPLR